MQSGNPQLIQRWDGPALLRQGSGILHPCRFFIGSKGYKLRVKTIPGKGLSHQPPFPEGWEMSASEVCVCVCKAGEPILSG